ncbi:MAG: argininosuccinate lyase [Alphaproteobacteria bacterium]|nr:argininosuccinate lyase [Alphaproteobacteria bacterium]
MKSTLPHLTHALLVAAALWGLAGCGYREGLERPPPMWGEARASHEREEAARRQAEEAAEAADQPSQDPQN